MTVDQVMTAISGVKLADWANIATISGILFAGIALVYTARQIRQTAKTSRVQFWLELEKMFALHDSVYTKLRPGGAWTVAVDSGPATVEEWASVEDYMGLFEHCELMLRKRLLDRETFDLIFSFRLVNIVANRKIVDAKLRQEHDSWSGFLSLLKRLKIEVPA